MNTEFVSAWRVLQTEPKPNHASVFQHFVNCCEKLKIPGVQDFLDRMLVFDFLIANEDRHLNNFGLLRDADTLEYIGPAPLFDNGTSLWFSTPTPLISARAKIVCKPFKNTHDAQLRLIQSLEWLDWSALGEIPAIWRGLVQNSLFVDAARCDAVGRALVGRIEMLKSFHSAFQPLERVDDAEGDVISDVAYSGS